MNKAELVAAMAEKSGLSNADAKRALDGLTEAVSNSLAKGDNQKL
jgi:DNA-binding protein HU-beta